MTCASPFPYFGGKRTIVDLVWSRFGHVRQYLEPFCGSAAMLMGAPRIARQETIGDQNLFVANFWRAVKYQPARVAEASDHPVVHIDMTARHRWLIEPHRTAALRQHLMDPEWPGDARIAGWWVWGQSAWIGSGWCTGDRAVDQVPRSACRGAGVHRPSHGPDLVTLADMFAALATRLRRCVVINGDWTRCLNSHYGRSYGHTADGRGQMELHLGVPQAK